MAGPWEQYAAAPAAAPTVAPVADDGPWAQYADHPAVKKFGLEDTWPARLVKSIYSAVTLPGDVAQGNVSMTGPDGHTNPEVIGRAAELASVATPLSPAARSGIGWAGALKTTDAPAPTEEALANAASAGYDKARGLNVEIHPQAISALGEKIGAGLNEMGIDGELAPKTFSILDRIKDAPADAVVTVPNLETLRRAFGHAAGDFTNPTEQLAAKRAQGHLADYLASIPDQDVIRGPASEVSGIIKDANANYAASKRSELITDELGKADQNAGAANSGANLGNAQRTKLKQIYQSDRKSAGYSDAELAQIDKIIRGTPLANATRTAGNALGGGGGLGAAITAGIGGAATAHLGGIGAIAPVVGYGLKKASDNLGEKQIELLRQMVRRRSPLGDSMPATMAGNVSPNEAFLARAIAAGFDPGPQRELTPTEKLKQQLMLRTALTTAQGS